MYYAILVVVFIIEILDLRNCLSIDDFSGHDFDKL